MGNCLITIHVTGSHHNGLESDIDQMAAKFADELAQRHNVTAGRLVVGGEYDLMNPATRFPVKAK